jgi:hypothetical protein
LGAVNSARSWQFSQQHELEQHARGQHDGGRRADDYPLKPNRIANSTACSRHDACGLGRAGAGQALRFRNIIDFRISFDDEHWRCEYERDGIDREYRANDSVRDGEDRRQEGQEEG